MSATNIELLGHGGAFDASSTAFLINDHILIDCGPDIVKSLLFSGRIKDIDTVFITHTHQDHVGGFELLLYYARFVTHRTLKVYASDAFWKYFEGCACTTKEDRMFIERCDFYSLVRPSNSIVMFDNKLITAFPVKHSGLEAYGYIVRARDRYAVFSGDTDEPITVAWKDPHLSYVFHDAGWTGIETDDFKVHPRDAEVIEACGDTDKLVLVHTFKDTDPRVRHAKTGDIFQL